MARWRPRSPWQWLLTVISALVLLWILTVGDYVVDPRDYGLLPSMTAYAVLIVPLRALLIALLGAFLTAVAVWSRAWLAASGVALATVLTLAMAIAPAISMWLIAKKEHVSVSVVSHFGRSIHLNELPPWVSRDVVYGRAADNTELVLDVWPATNVAPGKLKPAVVNVHGGGFISGSKSELPNWDAWLNELGYTVFDVDYRLPPPERWNSEAGDLKCALAWVVFSANKYGIDASRISIAGRSAGGTLAMLAAYSRGASGLPPSCDAPAVSVKSVINIYGPTDLASMYDTTRSPDYVRAAFQAYIGGSPSQFPARYSAVSPLNYISRETPPTITVLGLGDRIVPREQADRLDHALSAAGVIHETYLLPWVDHGYDANWSSFATQFSCAKIRSFLEKNR